MRLVFEKYGADKIEVQLFKQQAKSPSCKRKFNYTPDDLAEMLQGLDKFLISWGKDPKQHDLSGLIEK